MAWRDGVAGAADARARGPSYARRLRRPPESGGIGGWVSEFLAGQPRGPFDRSRRQQALARIAARLRFEPDDVSVMLPFDEVVAALGRRGQVDLGIRTIPLDSIVGTVDRRRNQFDRHFRPATGASRTRWEAIAAARRRG